MGLSRERSENCNILQEIQIVLLFVFIPLLVAGKVIRITDAHVFGDAPAREFAHQLTMKCMCPEVMGAERLRNGDRKLKFSLHFPGLWHLHHT